MARTAAINQCVLALSICLLTGCNDVYDYEVADAGKETAFKPHVGDYYLMGDPSSYSIHVKGELNGTGAIHLLAPNFYDINRQPNFCCMNDAAKIDSGKVDRYFIADYYLTNVTPTLLYCPCTATKGHLTITIGFGVDVKRKTIFEKLKDAVK